MIFSLDRGLVVGVDNDIVVGGQGSDTVVGGQGLDFVFGNEANDFVFGNESNDTIIAGQGADTVFAGQGDDSILGSEGNELGDHRCSLLANKVEDDDRVSNPLQASGRIRTPGHRHRVEFRRGVRAISCSALL